MSRVTVLDYGLGNLKSVAKAFAALGHDVVVTSDSSDIERASLLVVPGVSAFGACVERLAETGLAETIRSHIEKGRPYFGICLGYQVLFEQSEEDPGVSGLGIFHGTVRRFPAGMTVPHMGWNTVEYTREEPIFKGIPQKTYFYFVHSYYPDPEPELVAAVTEYGVEFASAIARDNVCATQFHPEKSSRQGLMLLENVYRWCMR